MFASVRASLALKDLLACPKTVAWQSVVRTVYRRLSDVQADVFGVVHFVLITNLIVFVC